ncbi:hypothetical protein SlGVgp028 [Spodoptera litura granulovirus]|uniref:Uncharacterized protein n=1 Tax=Spodoptera litura granulovirus TaxID=359919 RepID=A5IZN0_9BBAC|nr:hypothetical protein SlGVgp028 [Spodoptera litura granulovirus]ABQ51971.1 hypothetical protein SlGVgp028 [Spodoptera litura granulovirus]
MDVDDFRFVYLHKKRSDRTDQMVVVVVVVGVVVVILSKQLLKRVLLKVQLS